MTLSRACASVPNDFQLNRALRSTAPDCSGQSPREKTPDWVGKSVMGLTIAREGGSIRRWLGTLLARERGTMNNAAESNARRMWEARVARQSFANLPEVGAPLSLAQAYEAQEAYWRLAEPVYGPVAGVKVATTTKVMQQLMGITHPCGGAIFEKTIHRSPARISKAAFVNMRVESEVALKLGADMPAARAPWTAESAAECVAGAMPAFELIEDRNAVYTETRATSMIVDNCWNGG